MKRVKAVVPIFFVFLLLSILILFFFQNPLTEVLQFFTLPIQKLTYAASSQTIDLTPMQKLEQENNQLRMQLSQMQELQKDNQALHDQFKVNSPASKTLLPADIVGMQQNALLIDKGEQDSVQVGDVVVVNDNLVGKVTKITPHISLVTLLNDPSTSFTAETAKTSANGIVKVQDGVVIL